MRDFPEFKGPMADWPRVEVIEDVTATLEYLHQGMVCCLASNAEDSDAELMGIALARLNLRRYFHYLFTSHKLAAKKPDPDFYREILRRLGLAPEHCAAVGNDYLKDIVPAKSIGMTTIWFSRNPVSIKSPCADYIINSMDKLSSIIEKTGHIASNRGDK